MISIFMVAASESTHQNVTNLNAKVFKIPKDVKTNIKCHSTSTSRKTVPGFVTKLCSALKIIEDYDDGVNNSPNGEDYDEDNFDECV